jgi:hypothetical protein
MTPSDLAPLGTPHAAQGGTPSRGNVRFWRKADIGLTGDE